MYKYIATLLLALSYASPSHAVFSQFNVVTPDSIQHLSENEPQVTITHQHEQFHISVKNLYKPAWLIRVKAPIATKYENNYSELNFRNFIWAKNAPKQCKQYGCPPRPSYQVITDTQELFSPPEGHHDGGATTLTLSLEEMKHSYIYIDYPDFISDGGHYYTINLPAFTETD